MKTLIMSEAARNDRASRLSQNDLEKPNTIVNTPKNATARRSTGPTRRWIGRAESKMPTATAPTPGAARNTP